MSRHLAQGVLRFGSLTPGWTAATTAAPGHGPWQMLGRVYDTRPDECAYQPEVVEILKPTPAPGGVVLRAQYPSSSLEGERFIPFGALAIQLYVAAWDWFDTEAIAATWPGPKANSAHGFDLPIGDPDEPTAPARVKAWAANIIARNVLDVAPYLAQAGAEVDLGELGGGGRYVLAFWRVVYVRDTVDALSGVSVAVPWTLRAGRARVPCHRDRWCATLAIRTPTNALTAPTDLLLPPVIANKIGGFSPPCGGVATIACQNGSDNNALYTLFEEWSGGPVQRVTATWDEYVAFTPVTKAALPQRVSGALVVYAGTVAPGTTPHPALITVEVTR